MISQLPQVSCVLCPGSQESAISLSPGAGVSARLRVLSQVHSAGGLVAKSCRLFASLWTVARQAPLSMGFPGKDTGVGCHFLLHCRQILYHLSHHRSPLSSLMGLSKDIKFVIFSKNQLLVSLIFSIVLEFLCP